MLKFVHNWNSKNNAKHCSEYERILRNFWKRKNLKKKSEIISPHCSLAASGVINSYQDPNSLSSDFIIVLQLLCTACWKITLFELKKTQNQNNINNYRQKTYEYPSFKSFDITSSWNWKRILNLRILNCDTTYLATQLISEWNILIYVRIYLHCVANVQAVWPVYTVKCLCSRGWDWGREGSHSHKHFNIWFLWY